MEDPTEPFERSTRSFSDAISQQLKEVSASVAAAAKNLPPMSPMDLRSIKTLTGVVPVSKELLYPPTISAEERALTVTYVKERDARQAARHAELVASPNPVVRATAGLHSPKEVFPSWLECKGCDYAGHDGEPPQWPCRTWVLLDETVTANA